MSSNERRMKWQRFGAYVKAKMLRHRAARHKKHFDDELPVSIFCL